MNLPTWWVLIVLILKTDECASAFSLPGFEKEVPPQQADLIMKGNFQGVYAEKLINVITRNLSQMPKLLV